MNNMGVKINYSDRAIDSANQDLLGRSYFSRKLGEYIYKYSGTDSLVIGLYGQWGSGKTSIANMVVETIEEKGGGNDQPPIIIRFDPWNYSDKDNLILRFFSAFRTALGKSEYKNLKKLGNVISEYSEVFDITGFLPYVGPVLAPAMKGVSNGIGAGLKKTQDLDSIKNKLEKELHKSKQRFIVLIDDIDRLTDTQIRDVFQLVKQVGDLPNITYILVMDRAVVVNALSEVHHCDGQSYLDKIVQIPYEIPELCRTKVREIFLNKIDLLINEISPNREIDASRLMSLFYSCIDPWVITLRDVNRVVNTFEFKYSLLFSEVSFEDLLCLTTLEVLEPELYRWIATNRGELFSTLSFGSSKENKTKEEYKSYYENQFEQIGVNPILAMKCIASLFPYFGSRIGLDIGGNPSFVRSNMRIADQERFDLYFQLDMDIVKIPRSIVISLINEYSEEDIDNVIDSVNSQGNIRYLIDELRSLIDRIPGDRLEIIAFALFDNCGRVIKDNYYNKTGFSSKRAVSHFARELVERMGAKVERFNLYCRVLSDDGIFEIGEIAKHIRDIEASYNRAIDEFGVADNCLLNKEQLDELKKIFLERIRIIAQSGDLFRDENYEYSMLLWDDIVRDEAQTHFRQLLQNDINKMRYVCSMTGTWSSTSGGGWYFINDRITEYLDMSDVYNTIQKFDKTKLDEFDEIEKLKLATFVLETEAETETNITIERAQKLVDEWQKGNT